MAKMICQGYSPCHVTNLTNPVGLVETELQHSINW